MNFLESVALGFSNWKNFSGRACRSEYWYFVLFSVPALILVISVSSGVNSIGLSQVLMLGGAAFISVPAFALVVRRLHDQNITGWAIVISFVPILGELIIFIAMCCPGTDGDNKYGPPRVPLKRRDAVSAAEPQGSWVDEDD
jgi:uncharacterized membrane protein YhaH (DUF805 family)